MSEGDELQRDRDAFLRMCAGDPTGLDVVYRHWAKNAANMFRGTAINATDDVIQKAIIELWDNCQEKGSDPSFSGHANPQALFRSLITFRLRDWLRREKERKANEINDSDGHSLPEPIGGDAEAEKNRENERQRRQTLLAKVVAEETVKNQKLLLFVMAYQVLQEGIEALAAQDEDVVAAEKKRDPKARAKAYKRAVERISRQVSRIQKRVKERLRKEQGPQSDGEGIG